MHSSAGCRAVELADDEMALKFPALVLYPADVPERATELGPYTVDVAMDAPVGAGHYPLVVVSHGTGGSHLLHRTLAAHLARHGFVVALPEHPLNNRNNDELGGTAVNLANRPRHLSLVIDWAYEDAGIGPHLVAREVAVVGHSLGGYTALALAGGTPTSFPDESPDNQSRAVEVIADDRVKALVLLAPATPWFHAEGALRAVDVPILMMTAEKDEHCPAWCADIVTNGVRDSALVEHTIVPNAGHSSFESPFPPAMISPLFPPSQDPDGFDRAAFHERMNADVLEFLQVHCG